MRVWRMRTGISITLKPADRRRLKVLARDRNTPHKHVWRAEIVLLSADGIGTNEIMRRTGKSKTCVWRWQERFMEAGYDSLLHDKTRPSRIPPLGSNIIGRVVALTQTEPPAEATHDYKRHGTTTLFAALNVLDGTVIGRFSFDICQFLLATRFVLCLASCFRAETGNFSKRVLGGFL
jgi:hypothetical protein